MAKAENIVKGSYSHIIDTYNNASESSIAEGKVWYSHANHIAWQVTKLLGSKDIRVGAGIIASLSPQMDWGENVTEALRFVSVGYSTKQTRANNMKAKRISEGDDPETVLGGLKVTAFYHAILEPFGDTPPVVDRHAIDIHKGELVSKRDRNRAMSNPRVISRIQTSYKLASKKLGVHWHVVQAVTWVQQRKNKGYVKEKAWEK